MKRCAGAGSLSHAFDVLQKMKSILLAFAILSSLAFGSDYVPAEEIIRNEIDMVIYGTLKTFPDQKITMSGSEENQKFEFEFMRVEVHPWHYAQELSIRFRHQERYSGFVYIKHWPNEGNYETKPRFWGFKNQEIMGYTVTELRPRETDTNLLKIKEEVDSKYKNPTIIRPISLTAVKDSLSIKVVKEGEQLMLEAQNDSGYSVWYKMIAAERLASKEDSYTFTIQGQREDGNWIWGVCGLSGVGRENDRFAIPVEIKAKTTLRFPISVWKDQNRYEHFRAEGVLYPSSELINGLYMYSEPFTLKP